MFICRSQGNSKDARVHKTGSTKTGFLANGVFHDLLMGLFRGAVLRHAGVP